MASEQVGAVVVFEEVGAELLAGVVEEVEEIGVERAGAVGPDEIALLALEAERALGQRVDQAVDAAGADVLVGEEIPEFAGGGEVLAEVEHLPLAHMGLVPVRAGTDDKDLQFLEVREERERARRGRRHRAWPERYARSLRTSAGFLASQVNRSTRAARNT